MSTPVYQMAYMSRRAPATSNDIIVDDIVLPSITRNRKLDITGCLWFDNSHFFQVLEGDRSKVQGLVSSIVRDPRHRDINLLLEQEAPERLFERFGLRAATSSVARSMPSLLELLTLSEPKPPKTGKSRLMQWVRGDASGDPIPTIDVGAVRQLVSLVIDEMASWSETTPA